MKESFFLTKHRINFIYRSKNTGKKELDKYNHYNSDNKIVCKLISDCFYSKIPFILLNLFLFPYDLYHDFNSNCNPKNIEEKLEQIIRNVRQESGPAEDDSYIKNDS